jgi:acetylornithine deacetylase/succinyl-diaminopimelate desuccinylase-like protein
LPFYIEHLHERIGDPSLVVCLDSGAGNYEQLWCTTSLRGMVGGNLFVDILTEGVHSGDASGIVPSSFRIARQLLSRIEDERDGTIIPEWLQADVPAERIDQAERAADVLNAQVWERFPWVTGARPVADDVVQAILNRTWRPQLAVTGAAGLPALRDAGNVLRPGTALRLSLRLPPVASSSECQSRLHDLLVSDPPYGASVRFESEEASDGWNAPPIAPWLEEALNGASEMFFGKPPMYMGEGGTIPFMGMLGEQFPHAQFLITGVLGPESNAHGPNEFLHIPTAKRLTGCVAEVICKHARRAR